METVSFQLPEDMKNRLDSFAQKLDRSKGYLIRQAIQEYMLDLEDYLEAKSYKENYNPEENLSFAEIKKKYKFD